MSTRAKFRCTSETQTRYNTDADAVRTFEFQAIYDETLVDQSFAESTPSGSLKIVVTNPAVNFTAGASYYLDITPADAS